MCFFPILASKFWDSTDDDDVLTLILILESYKGLESRIKYGHICGLDLRRQDDSVSLWMMTTFAWIPMQNLGFFFRRSWIFFA